MKNATKQQKSKAYYLGTSTAITYRGSKTQPGYAGLPSGRKQSRRVHPDVSSKYRGGVVSKACEQIAKDKRRS